MYRQNEMKKKIDRNIKSLDDQSISKHRERSRTGQFKSIDNRDKNISKLKKEQYIDKKGKIELSEIIKDKKQRQQDAIDLKEKLIKDEYDNFPKELVIRFKSADGEYLGGITTINSSLTSEGLNKLVKQLKEEKDESYYFMIDDNELINSLKEFLLNIKYKYTSEKIVEIIYHPESLFSVKPLTRGTTSMEGHTSAILTCHFSPCSRYLATGGGDMSVRIWDMDTYTPIKVFDDNQAPVLIVQWSPCGGYLAAGFHNGKIALYKHTKGNFEKITSVIAHKKWVTFITWQPLHLVDTVPKLASSGKDGFLKIYSALNLSCLLNISAHSESLLKIIWSGEDYIYTCSQDKLLKRWSTNEGELLANYTGHAHWINSMAINTEFILRTGCYEYENINNKTSINSTNINFSELADDVDIKDKVKIASKRYNKLKYKLTSNGKIDRIITASDDFTLFLWDPLCELNSKKAKPVRLTGHQQVVNHVMFSPDTMFIASASFDKSIKVWNGHTGAFLFNLRGHVGSVYQISWSANSKFIVSASKDSTLKLWNIKADKKDKSCRFNLPGHADEVYCVDWSPSGEAAASGSKDTRVNIWKH